MYDEVVGKLAIAGVIGISLMDEDRTLVSIDADTGVNGSILDGRCDKTGCGAIKAVLFVPTT